MGSTFDICCPPDEEIKRDAQHSQIAAHAKIQAVTEDEEGNEILIEAPKIKDLAPLSNSGKDAYEKFEIGLPFCKIGAIDFFRAIEVAHQECGRENFVTIEALAHVLNTPAWEQLKQKDSRLCKVLLHSAFKNEEEGQSAEQIDVQYLQIYGFLLCSGKPDDKVEVLFNLLQEGGLQKHTFISAEDKDVLPFFQKVCRFATIHLFEFARDFVGFESPFEDNVADLLKVIDNEDDDDSL